MFPTGPEAPQCRQFLLFASEDGQAAENLGDKRTGLYYHELRAVLNKQAEWPPNPELVHALVKSRFSELRAAGLAGHTPIRHLWQSPSGDREEANLVPQGTEVESASELGKETILLQFQDAVELSYLPITSVLQAYYPDLLHGQLRGFRFSEGRIKVELDAEYMALKESLKKSTRVDLRRTVDKLERWLVEGVVILTRLRVLEGPAGPQCISGVLLVLSSHA